MKARRTITKTFLKEALWTAAGMVVTFVARKVPWERVIDPQVVGSIRQALWPEQTPLTAKAAPGSNGPSARGPVDHAEVQEKGAQARDGQAARVAREIPAPTLGKGSKMAAPGAGKKPLPAKRHYNGKSRHA